MSGGMVSSSEARTGYALRDVSSLGVDPRNGFGRRIVEKAFNEQQLSTVGRLMRSKNKDVAARAYRVSARDGRGPVGNREIQGDFSRNAILDRGRVSPAARRRGYDYLDVADQAVPQSMRRSMGSRIYKANPLSQIKFARTISYMGPAAGPSANAVAGSARSQGKLVDARLARRFERAQRGPAVAQAKQARRDALVSARQTPTGQTIGERRAAVQASQSARAGGTNIGSMERAAQDRAQANAQRLRSERFASMSGRERVGDAAKEKFNNASLKTKIGVGAGATGAGALMATGRKKESSYQEPTYAMYGKARYFDPENDRQRRMGMYAGVLGGGAVAAGSVAGRGGEFLSANKVIDDRKFYGVRGSKRGLIAAGLAGGLGAGSAAVYRRGVSRRNQAWT